MSIKVYKKKVIASGNILEVYEYEKEVLTGWHDDRHTGRSSIASEECQKENRDKVLSRARRDLRRLINCNVEMYGVSAKFITLTFKEEITCLELANYEFKKFRQRLEGYIEKDLKYVAVPEIQKERLEKYGVAVWHYHVVFFNLPFIRADKLSTIWQNGFIKVNRIDRVDNVGAYVCKYMTKDNKDLKGEKCYFSSRGLYKPVEVKEKERANALADALPSSALVYESTFENEYNSVSYKQYNMKRVKVEDAV